MLKTKHITLDYIFVTPIAFHPPDPVRKGERNGEKTTLTSKVVWAKKKS